VGERLFRQAQAAQARGDRIGVLAVMLEWVKLQDIQESRRAFAQYLAQVCDQWIPLEHKEPADVRKVQKIIADMKEIALTAIQSAQAEYLEVVCLFEQKRYDKVLELLERLSPEHRYHVETLRTRLSCYQRLQRFEEGAAFLSTVNRLLPDETAAGFARAFRSTPRAPERNGRRPPWAFALDDDE